MKKTFIVTGMTCSACSATVDKNVSKLNGVNSVNVNLLSNKMIVDYDQAILSDDEIIAKVISCGYNASLEDADVSKNNKSIDKTKDEMDNMKKRLIISFIFLIPLMYISMGHMMSLPLPMVFHDKKYSIVFAFTQFLLVLPIAYVNRKYYYVGFKTLIKRSPNMDSLIAIGSLSAIIYGIFAIYKIGIGLGFSDISTVNYYRMDLYFESAGTILTLITLGKYLEAKSKSKTSDSIDKLINLAPKTATILKDGKEIEVLASNVMVGDIVIIKPGNSIPVDGIIIEGSSSIDESAITGESVPVFKQVNDGVISATINKNGHFKFKATKVGKDTTISQIIELVENASSSKAPIARLADKISSIFVPTVISIAIITTIVWLLLGYSFEFSLSLGISVLVISCPCALGLATPVAIMVGTGKGAENGILFKNAESLETTHSISKIILDKTGTITEGKPKVTDIITTSNITEEELLKIAASIETLSEHPLADAIVTESKNRNINLLKSSNFISIEGQGINAQINDKTYYAGNIKLMKNQNIDINTSKKYIDELSSKGKTTLFFADDKQLLGIIAVADQVKPTSIQAINKLKENNIDVYMLTGDNKLTAKAIAKQVNIDNVISEVLPQEKEAHVRKLQEQGYKVAMVGDGINDAPALVRADVGIAIGAGSDIAIDSADVILMKSDLQDAVTAIRLSKATIKNIKENLFWAFIYNIIGIPIACGILYTKFNIKLNPMIAAATMSFSSVTVVLNALRLKYFNNNKQEKLKGVKTMKKVVKIDGMMCNHCTGRVSEILNNIDGVEANVSLEDKCAYLTLSSNVEDSVIKKAIEDAGYTVISIE